MCAGSVQDKIQLGRSDLQVSKLGLGTLQWGDTQQGYGSRFSEVGDSSGHIFLWLSHFPVRHEGFESADDANKPRHACGRINLKKSLTLLWLAVSTSLTRLR